MNTEAFTVHVCMCTVTLCVGVSNDFFLLLLTGIIVDRVSIHPEDGRSGVQSPASCVIYVGLYSRLSSYFIKLVYSDLY